MNKGTGSQTDFAGNVGRTRELASPLHEGSGLSRYHCGLPLATLPASFLPIVLLGASMSPATNAPEKSCLSVSSWDLNKLCLMPFIDCCLLPVMSFSFSFPSSRQTPILQTFYSIHSPKTPSSFKSSLPSTRPILSKVDFSLVHVTDVPCNRYLCNYWFTHRYLLQGFEVIFGRECVLSFPCRPASQLCTEPGPEQCRHQPDQGRGCRWREKKWICPHGMRPTSGIHMHSSH